ncbi:MULTISPECIES: DUF2614 family zinc ribbon-containing protein [Lacrimispora]|uniref:DUF2614 family zinc ribbon-containing protein n=1 Tax=Lacrimispora TaxID=2719231 RepID=UPI000BE35D2C|nr:DUF2614 family zinc ribbon-containing protein [Lacrimispora amygdalina]MDK2964947.1 hypothetical protein [Lacrimispora sp.]
MSDTKEAFKKKKKLQILVPILGLIVAIILFLISIRPAAVVVIIGVVIFSKINWRCPKCNHYLGKGSNPKICSNCGEELQ